MRIIKLSLVLGLSVLSLQSMSEENPSCSTGKNFFSSQCQKQMIPDPPFARVTCALNSCVDLSKAGSIDDIKITPTLITFDYNPPLINAYEGVIECAPGGQWSLSGKSTYFCTSSSTNSQQQNK